MTFLRAMVFFYRLGLALGAGLLVLNSAHAGFFEDDEARKAIVDLRQRVDGFRNDVQQNNKAIKKNLDETAALSTGQLDLHRQLELLRADLATLRGVHEQLAKELADMQRRLKDDEQDRVSVNQRLTRFEPSTVSVDGVEFMAEPLEKRDYESALGVFREGDFAAAQTQFAAFLERYRASGYSWSALFWLGNARYATRDYKEAIANFRALTARNPEHARVPEAMLSIANCQLELKDAKSARKTLADLIKAHPKSEAAVAARERLAALK